MRGLFNFFYLLPLLLFQYSYSLTAEVSGDIIENTTWIKDNSPYIITNTVKVDSNVTLTLKPGVIVKFNYHSSIYVSGELIARGTENDSIYFIRNESEYSTRWGTIGFINSSVDAVFSDKSSYISGSIIEYARIEGAGRTGINCENASPFIHRNLIINNKVYSDLGGGISCYNSSSIISENTIIGNGTLEEGENSNGGGIACWYSSPIIIKNKIFYNNAYNLGGGIYCYESSPTISDNEIYGNSARTGSGIYCDESSLTISGNLISKNYTYSRDGGGIYCYNSSLTVSGNTIIDNKAYDDGGGISGSYSSLIISNNTISDNLGRDAGGGIFCQYSSLIVFGNTVSKNKSYDGGGIFCRYNTSPKINYNNIFDNRIIGYSNGFNILSSNEDMNAENNWWGTSIKDSMVTLIHPFDIIDFEPFLTSATPIRISSLVLKSDSRYSTDLSSNLFIGDTLFIELSGMDGDSTAQDYTDVFVKSISDTAGVSVKLKETDVNSGIYRGTAFIQNVSNDDTDMINAAQGDIIKILSTVDISVDISVYDSVMVSQATSVDIPKGEIPDKFRIFRNFPNPFNPETHIKYKIPKTSELEIKIYNSLGQKIKTILNEIQNPGVYNVIWDGTNEQGIAVSSGIYLYVIKTEGFFEAKKMVLIR